mgnify:CR=1 FL=1
MDCTRDTRGNGDYMQPIVIDNFLDKKDFDELHIKIMGRYFPWFHFDEIILEEEHKKDMTFYETHMMYDNDRPLFTTSFELMDPVLDKLMKLEDPNIRMISLVRVKVNSYPNQGKLIEHGMHRDYAFPSVACLFGMNTCNGYTRIGDKKIDSVANRAILFDPSTDHSSTSTTNDTRRVNINFNYLNVQGNIFK